ncbi:MAG: hypothetical protein QMD77_01975 [Patescibacteria group bacterium]|nr:hypothetical protein [Patescibacteria group bacterium]
MTRKVQMIMVLVLGMVLVFGASMAWGGMFPDLDAKIAALKAKEKAIGAYQAKVRAQGAKDQADMKRYDAAEKAAAAGAARAHKIAADAAAKQDKICKVVGFVPVLGLGMRQYNAGEMRACRQDIADFKAGKKRVPGETYGGLKHLFWKLPAALPELAATDFLWQFTFRNWREQDPVTVFVSDGRPYWMDGLTTATKIAFGVMAPYGLDVGLPDLGNFGYAEPVNQAFLWMAAAGGTINLVSGTGYQAFTGMKAFNRYYDNMKWWTSNNTL